MIQHTKTISVFVAVIAIAMLLATLVTAPVAASSIWDGLLRGAELTDPDATVLNVEDQATQLIASIINILSLVVGVVAVVMIIIGGFKYITSGGDSGNVTGAKNTILYAVIGLVIVALAQIIVRFVLDRIIE